MAAEEIDQFITIPTIKKEEVELCLPLRFLPYKRELSTPCLLRSLSPLTLLPLPPLELF
ncbi:hypothetical protein M404DRAFT_26546 [Pisolithus tinctorius Marx 270]|uniref:Uncharacterized protein n=1 Tax=Pisolithus tinctorius Marx 270 TaxID=870435 RepID=A0A0C3K354_PISTI|nr:hypothetical protein M404DRAFT_26546 [Pisolithus tinctorius Marx 270]